MTLVKPIASHRRGVVRAAVVAVASVVAVLAGVLFFATGPLDAQAPQPASFTVGQAIAAGETFEVAISFSPGDEVVGAMSGVLNYDPTYVTAVDCRPGLGGGSCNVIESGVVRFAMFNSAGFDAGDVATIMFANGGAGATSDLTLELRGIYDLEGQPPVQEPVIENGEVVWLDVFGFITGEVSAKDTGEGLFGLDVCSTSLEPAPDNVDVLEMCTTTDGLGNFTIDDLFVGEYAVAVTDPGAGYTSSQQAILVVPPDASFAIFELEAAGNGGDPIDPVDPVEPIDPVDPVDPIDPVDPTDPTDPVVPTGPADPSDPVNGRITGTVTNTATSGPVFGVRVCATAPVTSASVCDITDMSGMFEIDGLRTSNYVLSADDPVKRFTSDNELLLGVVRGSAVSGADLTVSPAG